MNKQKTLKSIQAFNLVWSMANQKWYEKATVQAALVAIAPSIITAIIAIISIVLTYKAANTQIELNKDQYERDSINSALQLELVLKQIELANRSFLNDSVISLQQLNITRENYRLLESERNIKRSADWGKLRNTMWAIFDLTTSGAHGFVALDSLSEKEKENRSNKILILLNSEIDNPVLIDNKKCLGYWRNAISKSKNLKDKALANHFKFSEQVSSLMNDVIVVWAELVLDSKEVSPTGGKPIIK
ncbi:MAG: hypothetical protein IPH97_00655 [Ignavibacteriales bacterium]|nr:hypothetical protein [Ignavibacteriales bacterium]MBK7631294.1 hypothetical protein [Ignavibacteriales bacterium]